MAPGGDGWLAGDHWTIRVGPLSSPAVPAPLGSPGREHPQFVHAFDGFASR